MKRVYILAILAVFIGSCQDEVMIGDIDDDLRPFVESFIEEAGERGLELDIDNLDVSVTIMNIPNTNIQGQCSSLTDDRHVTIDNSYWRSLKDDFYGREFLVYHELGHCILLRQHFNATDGQGNCSSIMAAGDAACDNTYSPETREEFLDELFN